jgi:hypothetical protein
MYPFYAMILLILFLSKFDWDYLVEIDLLGRMNKNKHLLILYICLFLSNRVHVFLSLTNTSKSIC